MASAKEIRRGSRAWFTSKLKAIEALGGEDAHALAVEKWAQIVWENPIEAAFEGADWIDRIHRLASASAQLKDKAASDKIKSVMLNGDDAEIIRIESLLDDKKIKKAIRAQCMDEDRIRELASHYQDRDDPTRHLRVRKYLRREIKQSVAILNMTLGLIGRDGYNHITPHELDLRNQQKARWAQFGESITLNRGKEQVNMLTVMQAASIKKLAEVYTLVKGLESYAKAAGLSWAFITLTAPPRMHSNPSNGQNTWDGSTPAQAHEWIHQAFHRTESRLRKQNIIISGLRVVESHRDGCPHWHVLVFAHKNDMATIEATFRQQPEWKAEHGMKFIEGDGRATAASYCFKYILKTINSIEKLSGEVGAMDAWRSTWCIRGFQWIGMPRIQLWRDLRAVKECPADPLLAGLWRAAHRGDGHAFIGLAGGLNVKNKSRPVTSKTTGDTKTKRIEFILQDTGEAIRFDFAKWQRTSKSIEKSKVEVILNCPRKTQTQTPLTRPGGACPPSAGRGGNDSLHDLPNEGRECLIRGFPSPHFSPPYPL